jgi:hypothetical protein
MYEKYHQKAEFFPICLRDLTSPLWLIQITDIHNYFKKFLYGKYHLKPVPGTPSFHL